MRQFLGFLWVSFAALNFSWAIEGQLKEIEFVASPGHMETGVLDEIRIEDLRRVNPVPAKCSRCYQDFNVAESVKIKLQLQDMTYLLRQVRFTDSSLKGFTSMTFEEPKTGSDLQLIFSNNKVILSLSGHQAHSLVKVNSSY